MTSCEELVTEWGVEPGFAARVAEVINRTEQETSRSVEVISGFRTRAEQERLIRSARPAAPVGLSNHTRCPAHAVDVTLGPFPTLEQKKILGANVALAGLRWGGGSPLDDDGIPTDWPHIDDGPRPARS